MADRTSSATSRPVLPIGRGGPGGPGGHGAMGRRIEQAKDARGTIKRLARYFKPYWHALIAVAVLVVAGTGLSLLGPDLMGKAIDAMAGRQGLAIVGRFLLGMLGIYLLSWLSGVGQAYIMAGVSQRLLRTLRRDLFQHLQALSLSFFDRYQHGELMSRLTNDIETLNMVLSMGIASIVADVITLVGVVVLMFAINVWLALVAMIILPLMLLFTASIARRTRAGFRDLQMQLGQLNALMEETITGQKVVQAFGQEKRVIQQFDVLNAKVRDTGTRAQILSLLVPPMMTVLANADIALIVGLGGWLALKGLVTVGAIAAFISYARRFSQPLRQIADLYNSIQAGLAGAERVFEILDEVPDVQDAPNAVPLENVRGEVEFDHVNFEYVPGVPVLKDVCLHAMPGQTIALVGPTGAGKTTIVNLLSRFYDVQSGAIRIDGRDIRTVTKDSLRRQLGIVLQDTFLFTGTVMENIRYGRLEATDEEVIAAAKLANADSFIRRLPKGYQTELSEQAANLSQGQRQLLAIARAVLADPRILVLDEATSSVDTRTEMVIQEALLRLMEGRTAFVIAHRLSTIRKADLVLVIHNGEIIERGTHEELLAKRGFYYRLYMSQFRGVEQALLAAE